MNRRFLYSLKEFSRLESSAKKLAHKISADANDMHMLLLLLVPSCCDSSRQMHAKTEIACIRVSK